MSDELCTVCRRRPPTRGVVCEGDRDWITARIADLPRRIGALSLQLIPAATGLRGDRVSTTRVGSPPPTNVDALSLTGPGTDTLSARALTAMLHPKIRRWCTRSRCTVTVTVGGRQRQVDREVVQWHQEPVLDATGHPMMEIADDQTGLLPPAEWLEVWATYWRSFFGHHHPPAMARGHGKDPASARIGAGALALAEEHRRATNLVLGLVDGNSGIRRPDDRPDDPLAEEWRIRFGAPDPGHGVRRNVAYLLAWFDQAAERGLVTDLAVELRALDAELTRVLGEQPDQQWLGRCPTTLTDRDTGAATVCGAGLWQDPHASQVQCPRCRSVWGPKRLELFALAAEIRRVWPIDRHRRYTNTEASQLLTETRLLCPGCGTQVDIAWRDVTALGERERWWRPDRATCPNGCPEVGRVI